MKLLTVVILSGLGFDLTHADEGLCNVGVAKIDITPSYRMRLNAYPTRPPESEGVEQRLWAKALAIGTDEVGPALLIIVENLGIPHAVTEEVADRLRRKAGVARERVAVCATHVHTAPTVSGSAPLIFAQELPLEQRERIDRYTRELTDKMEQVALAALADQRPSRLAWSQGQVGFAINRRLKDGPVDRDLPMLCVTDTAGNIRAILVNYACHCTTLGPDYNRICGDWAGYAQEYIERDHPGTIALVAIGCAGDINPQPRLKLSFAKQHGQAVAAEVKRLLQGKLRPIAGRLIARLRRIVLPFDELPTREQWLRQAADQRAQTAYHARVQLERLDRGEALATTLSYPIQTWCFGDDLAMVFLAGEVLSDYSLRLKREFDRSRLWVNAYANDVPCYVASKRALRERAFRYEAELSMHSYDRPTRFTMEVEDLIVNTVHKLLPVEFYAPEKRAEYPPPKSPLEALAAFRYNDRIQVDLTAAEPLVIDPVAIDFGADGRLWVVEYYDYPTGVDENWTPGGRIKFLRDTNGDGCYDTATLFLDDVSFPTGIMEWRKGVLISAAPDVLYAEDADGDGRADFCKVLFTGFATSNLQARVNGFRYGLDGWVYGSSGRNWVFGDAPGEDGTIRSVIGNQRVLVGPRDFRFSPDSGEIQPVAGDTQFCRVRDDWGNWFGTTNSYLLRHYPMPEHYLNRNPHIAGPEPSVNVMRGVKDWNRLFPTSRPLMRFNDPQSLNRVTSACGPDIYRDQLLGSDFFGDAFTCEPVHNLVTRRKLSPEGVSFTGRRASGEQQLDFLTSTDNWFRPVQVRTGIDGALWVVDMYRFVIEHPIWIPQERLAQLDVRAGCDKGRIYRVYLKNKLPRPIRNWREASTSELAAGLDSPNGVQRDLIHRLLVHRGDQRAVKPLIEIARHSRWPMARLQSLWVLNALGALSADLLEAALADAQPQVRRHAVRLAERYPNARCVAR